MRGPSDHLSWAELACHDGTPYPEAMRQTRGAMLAHEFETIREACGNVPVRVGSAYRTPAHNATIGGAKRSQHLQGRALDLYPPKGWTIDAFYKVVRTVARDDFSAIRGLGKYPRFIHIDIRPIANNRLVVWRGTRAWAELRTAAEPDPV